jgi:hypothetical protein
VHSFNSPEPLKPYDAVSHIGVLFAAIIALALVTVPSSAPAQNTIGVSVSESKAFAGDTVRVVVRTRHGEMGVHAEAPHAVLLTPGVGVGPLSLSPADEAPGTFHAAIIVGKEPAEGLYIIHVWAGDRAHPLAVGKGSFRVGQIVADFLISTMVDTVQPDKDMDDYLQSFKAVGGNFLIGHNLITGTKAYFPSRICRTDILPNTPKDVVELTLSHADKSGMAVMLSITWDATRNAPYGDRMKEIKGIISELYAMYARHPSLIGFYASQEGSGTYYVPFIREFCDYVKGLNPNLLTGCAPYMDDPLLAGYLSVVKSLDVIIYQAGVEASYRTDNMKKYPFRRVHDICGIGAGARRVQDKIALNHVELFGYFDQRVDTLSFATTYENIIRQILSAATITDADGIAFFTYHAHIYDPLKHDPNVERSRLGVVDGMKAYEMITSQVTLHQNLIDVYVPYSDWIVERWADCYLPGFDALRVLGIPMDILPYAPPVEESLLPYYPFHLNPDVLARLTKDHTVLLLPNVSGFQQTDSDLIKAFLEAGGVVVAFGPQIPGGRSYERVDLFGITEGGTKEHRSVVTKANGPRVIRGKHFSLSGGVTTSEWTAVSATTVAAFEDGSPAVVTHRYGKGMTVSILTSAAIAARCFPRLVLDVIDEAVNFAGRQRVADVIGLNEKSDIAEAQTSSGFRLVVANHDTVAQHIEVVPLVGKKGEHYEWFDAFTGKRLPPQASRTSLHITVPPSAFRYIEYRP